MPASSRRRPQKPTPSRPRPGLAVDDYVVALQKSFSRVATRSREEQIGALREGGTGARSLVIGTVHFRTEIHVKLSEDGEHLLIDPEGEPLTFEGNLVLDQYVDTEKSEHTEDPNK